MSRVRPHGTDRPCWRHAHIVLNGATAHRQFPGFRAPRRAALGRPPSGSAQTTWEYRENVPPGEIPSAAIRPLRNPQPDASIAARLPR